MLPRTLRSLRKGYRQRGFSLVEVLVALLVLSFGMIGLAMLQTVGMKFNTNSYSRTQSTLLAYDMIDRMRANPAAILNSDYDVADTTAANTVIGSTVTDCAANTCTSTEMAKYDLKKWYELQNKLVPGAKSGERSTITRPSASSRTVTVTLRWMEDDLLKEQIWEVEL